MYWRKHNTLNCFSSTMHPKIFFLLLCLHDFIKTVSLHESYNSHAQQKAFPSSLCRWYSCFAYINPKPCSYWQVQKCSLFKGSLMQISSSVELLPAVLALVSCVRDFRRKSWNWFFTWFSRRNSQCTPWPRLCLILTPFGVQLVSPSVWAWPQLCLDSQHAVVCVCVCVCVCAANTLLSTWSY